MRRTWLLGSAGCLIAAMVWACGPQAGAEAETRKRKIADSIDLPPGVFWDVESKFGATHSPRCTIREEGPDIVLSVEVGLVQTKDDYLQELRVVGPGPEFAEVLRYPIEQHVGKWSHEFRIAKKSLPKGARYLIVYVTCSQHGSLGVSQAI